MKFKFIAWLNNYIAKVFTVFFADVKENDKFNSMNEQIKTLVVAKFIFDSEPIGNEMGRVWIGDFLYNGKIDDNGKFEVSIPGNNLVRFTYGDTLQFSREIFIPSQKETFFIGKYDWSNGNVLSSMEINENLESDLTVIDSTSKGGLVIVVDHKTNEKGVVIGQIEDNKLIVQWKDADESEFHDELELISLYAPNVKLIIEKDQESEKDAIDDVKNNPELRHSRFAKN